MKTLILQTHPSEALRQRSNLDILDDFSPQKLNEQKNNYLLSIPDDQKIISIDLEGHLPAIFAHEAAHWGMTNEFIPFYENYEVFYDHFSLCLFERIYNFNPCQKNAHYIILKPNVGFQTWLIKTLSAKKQLPKGNALLTLDALETLAGVYYLPATITEQSLLFSYLQENAVNLLKNELKHFEKSKKYWPKDLSVGTFYKFFKVEHQNKVISLSTDA